MIVSGYSFIIILLFLANQGFIIHRLYDVGVRSINNFIYILLMISKSFSVTLINSKKIRWYSCIISLIIYVVSFGLGNEEKLYDILLMSYHILVHLLRSCIKTM